MGRPRKWADDAERMRAKRGASQAVGSDDVPSPAGERGPDEGVVRDPPAADGPDLGTVVFDGKTYPIVRRHLYCSEADYVHAEVEITRGLIERGLKDPDGKRLDRARANARWRYRGWLAGEVTSL